MKISGHVDLCGPELIEGWLYCGAWDDGAIGLQVFLCGELLGECVADRFRPDLQEAGFGDGRCGFSFTVPESLAGANFDETRLRLIGTSVFLLPDEFSNVSRRNAVSPEHMISGSDAALVSLATPRLETSAGASQTAPNRPRFAKPALQDVRHR